MKILLIHSEDDPEKGPWANLAWDRVVDLGLAGVNAYDRWTSRFRCAVTPLDALRNGFEELRRVRDLLTLGNGRLIDSHHLDWWEIMSLLLHGEMEALVLLQRFVNTLASNDEVHVSRPGLHASLLQCLLMEPVNVFPLRSGAQRSGLGHYLRVSKRLSLDQMLDVFCDKYDSGYRLRRRFARKQQPSRRPVVLLPTAYVNVSRTGLAYANTFPQESFLLVATRRSGWVQHLPQNLAPAWLSSYASLRPRRDENADLGNRWQSLLNEFRAIPEFKILHQLGYLEIFPQRFRHGLEVRDAWRNVLNTEPVEAVLCADDSNPYTRIPLLLARERGLPNVACHHGALDGRYVFKRSYGDVIWAKGKMEEDYLVRKCGVPPERVEIAAPALPASWNAPENPHHPPSQPHLLFLSEAFEAGGGRAEEFYLDILPPLANLALSTGRRLVVKLHPAESESERTRFIDRIMTAEQKSVMQVVTGPLTEDLLANAWCGITILSTVAVECAVRGVPCFLCRWLESWPYGYVEQFIRYGVGIGLNHPGEIARIPEYLQSNPVRKEVRENCWQPAAPGRLRELIIASKIRTTALI